MKVINLLVFLALFLFIIAACTPEKKCESANDCDEKQDYSVKCSDEGKCEYTKQTSSGLVSSSQDFTNAGDKFRIAFSYNNPFDVSNDLFNVKLSLVTKSEQSKNRVITKIELTGVGKKTGRTLLASKEVNKPLWDVGSEYELDEDLKIDSSLSEREDFNELSITVYYNYIVKTGTKLDTKQAQPNVNLNKRITLTKTISKDQCSSCKDKKGYKTICDSSTNLICEYESLSNICGNYRCESEANETRCNCKTDCGPCSGTTESLIYNCVSDKCVGQIKPTIVVKNNNILDQKKQSEIPFTLHYVFNNPFNVQTDTFDIKFLIDNPPQNINNIRIEDIRLLEGQQEIVAIKPRKILSPNKEITISVKIPEQNMEEVKKSITVVVEFSFNKDNQSKEDKFQKQFSDKVTILTS